MRVVFFNQCLALFDCGFTISARNRKSILVTTELAFPKGKKTFWGVVDAD
jgi:hypothetical protein